MEISQIREFIHEITNKLTVIDGKAKKLSKSYQDEDVDKLLKHAQDAIKITVDFRARVVAEEA